MYIYNNTCTWCYIMYERVYGEYIKQIQKILIQNTYNYIVEEWEIFVDGRYSGKTNKF